MENLVTTNSSGRNITTSLKVADTFGKRHADVLRDVQNLNCSTDFNERNFALIEYKDSRGRRQTAYEMTKDGFSFLVMGYTGDKAGQFKETFINEFNKRESLLNNDDFIVHRALSILTDRARALEEENQRKDVELQLAQETIKEQAPKVVYHDRVLQSGSPIKTNVIAMELGMTAIKLNRILSDHKIIYRQGDNWLLFARYRDKGYAVTRTFSITKSNGVSGTVIHLYWTEKGRKLIHDTIQHNTTTHKTKKIC